MAQRAYTVLATVFILIVLNCNYPVVQFADPLPNYMVALAAMCLPWMAVVCAFWFVPLWKKIVVVVVTLLVGVVCLFPATMIAFEIVGIREAGRDRSFTPVSQVELLGSVVRAYETNGGATTDFGLVVRQEKLLLPGILLVRELYSEYHAIGGGVELDGPDTVRVIPYRRGERVGEHPLVVRVRPYLWF